MNPNNERNQMSVKINDIFAVPLTKVNWEFSLWFITVLFTIIPGTFLCFVTLGGFRYFYLMGKLCNYLVDKSLNQEQQWT